MNPASKTHLELLRELQQQLSSAGKPAAESRWILCHAGGLNDKQLAARLMQSVTKDVEETAWAMLRLRVEGYPLQLLLGKTEFYGLTLWVERGVLIPRPETEGLVERALAYVPPEGPSRVLDVGTGTGRLPRALLFQPRFHGHVVGLDLSRRMLAHAAHYTRPYADRVTLIWQDARFLPFPDNTFDAVTSLEMLEFTPDPRGVLAEMVRVLRPGGILLVTNRVGREATLLPGRAFSRDRFYALLEELPLENIQVQLWQVDYDLVWARKTGRPMGGGTRPLAEVLRCPECGRVGLTLQERAYRCEECGQEYPVAPDGVVEMARKRAGRWSARPQKPARPEAKEV